MPTIELSVNERQIAFRLLGNFSRGIDEGHPMTKEDFEHFFSGLDLKPEKEDDILRVVLTKIREIKAIGEK